MKRCFLCRWGPILNAALIRRCSHSIRYIPVPKFRDPRRTMKVEVVRSVVKRRQVVNWRAQRNEKARNRRVLGRLRRTPKQQMVATSSQPSNRNLWSYLRQRRCRSNLQCPQFLHTPSGQVLSQARRPKRKGQPQINPSYKFKLDQHMSRQYQTKGKPKLKKKWALPKAIRLRYQNKATLTEASSNGKWRSSKRPWAQMTNSLTWK